MREWIRPRLAAGAILLVFVLLCFVVAVELLAVARGRYPTPALVMRDLAMPFYLWAIWSARRAVLLIGRGEALHAVLSRLLARIGAALFLGGLAAVFGAPLLLMALRRGGALAFYDVAAITVGVVGVTLMIVARLIAEAEAMRAELDEIV